MKLSKIYLVLVAVMLQGCTSVDKTLVAVPTPAPFTGASGEFCVASTAKIGDTIWLDRSGTSYTVKSLSADSKACPQKEYPTRANITKNI